LLLATFIGRRRGNAPRFACTLFGMRHRAVAQWVDFISAGATFIPTFRRRRSFPAAALRLSLSYAVLVFPSGHPTFQCDLRFKSFVFILCSLFSKLKTEPLPVITYRTASLSASSLFYSVGIWRYRLKNFKFQVVAPFPVSPDRGKGFCLATCYSHLATNNRLAASIFSASAGSFSA